MVILGDAPMPAGDQLVYPPGHPQALAITRPWLDWFTNLSNAQGKSSGVVASYFQTGLSGDISLTALGEPLQAGLYRVSYYARLTVTDSVSASVDVTVGFTWNGAARSWSNTGLIANTLTETATHHALINVDSLTLVTFSTTTSFFGGDGRYALDVVLEQVQV